MRCLVVLVCFSICLASARGDEALRLFMRGDFLFQKNCAACHGTTGRGEGAMGREAEPLPRNFREGVFKFRSTPMGFLPTDEDLLRTIRRGIAGTAMPAFEHFNDSESKALIAYIKGFSKRWEDESLFGKPIAIPAIPDWMDDENAESAHVVSGKSLFAIHCASCHGKGGKGDGPAAPGLKDAWEKPVSPADLTLTNLRSGPGPEDVFRTVATGIDGTPMVGHLETLGPEKIWDVVAYVRSLTE